MADRLPRVLEVRPQQDGVDIDLRVEADLPWFEGHFPDLPILPGVVQLDWALHFARTQGIIGLPAARSFQVKFRSIIRPHDALTLTLRRKSPNNQVAFEFRRGPVVCSLGKFFVGEA